MCILPELDLILGALPAVALCQIYTPLPPSPYSYLLSVEQTETELSLLERRNPPQTPPHLPAHPHPPPLSSPLPRRSHWSPQRDCVRIRIQSCCPWVCVSSRFKCRTNVLLLICLFCFIFIYLFYPGTQVCVSGRRAYSRAPVLLDACCVGHLFNCCR